MSMEEKFWFNRLPIWIRVVLCIFLGFIFIPILIYPTINRKANRILFISIWSVTILIVFGIMTADPNTESQATKEEIAGASQERSIIEDMLDESSTQTEAETKLEPQTLEEENISNNLGNTNSIPLLGEPLELKTECGFLGSFCKTKISNGDKNTIRFAQLIPASEVPERFEGDLEKCFYKSGSGINNSESFDCKDGFYLKIFIDNKNLSSFMHYSDKICKESGTCAVSTSDSSDYYLNNFITTGGRFSDESETNCSNMYGKYKNIWSAKNSIGDTIPGTDKFDGFNIYDCKRLDGFDEIILGSFFEKPKSIVLVSNIYGDDIYGEFEIDHTPNE